MTGASEEHHDQPGKNPRQPAQCAAQHRPEIERRQGDHGAQFASPRPHLAGARRPLARARCRRARALHRDLGDRPRGGRRRPCARLPYIAEAMIDLRRVRDAKLPLTAALHADPCDFRSLVQLSRLDRSSVTPSAGASERSGISVPPPSWPQASTKRSQRRNANKFSARQNVAVAARCGAAHPGLRRGAGRRVARRDSSSTASTADRRVTKRSQARKASEFNEKARGWNTFRQNKPILAEQSRFDSRGRRPLFWQNKPNRGRGATRRNAWSEGPAAPGVDGRARRTTRLVRESSRSSAAPSPGSPPRARRAWRSPARRRRAPAARAARRPPSWDRASPAGRAAGSA